MRIRQRFLSENYEEVPEPETGNPIEDGEKEYRRRTINTRIQDLQSTSLVLLTIYMFRLALGIISEYNDPRTWSIALPCLSTVIISISIIKLYFAKIVKTEKNWDVHRFDRLLRINGLLCNKRLIVCILLLLSFLVVKNYEQDIPGRMIGSLFLFLMTMMLYKQVIQNIYNAIGIAILYIILIYWCFAQECKQVGHIMGMSTLLISISIFQINKGLKEYRENFVFDWKIQQDKNLYESLLLVLKDSVCILSESRVLFFNRACKENFKMNANNFKSILETFHLQGESNLLSLVEQKFSSSHPSGISCKECFRKNEASSKDSQYQVFIIDQALEKSQKTIALVLRDLTEEQELEEKKIQQQFQQLLFLSLSHEVRTPLNAIQGLLSIVGGKRIIEESLHSKIKEGKIWCQILSSEISNILDYAHIAFGKFKTHINKIKISKLIKRANRFLKTLLDEKVNNILENLALSIGSICNKKFNT